MAFALVGSVGTAVQTAAGGTASPAWGASENRTAGNLLILTVTVTGVATLPGTPANWIIGRQRAGTSCSATVYYKIATGADAAPTVAGITSGLIAAQLSEYSGNATSNPVDEAADNVGTSSPVTATFAAADDATGALQVMAAADRRSVARASNDTWTSNHGTPTLRGSNNGTSSTDHYSNASLVTTSNSGGGTSVVTLSITTSITGIAVAAISFRQKVSQPLTAPLLDAAPALYDPTIAGAVVPPQPFNRDNRLVQHLAH